MAKSKITRKQAGIKPTDAVVPLDYEALVPTMTEAYPQEVS